MKRLAIICTHPIQYYAPLFRQLSERMRISVKVFYTWEKEASSFDTDFGKIIMWDISLTVGYDYMFVSNGGNLRRDFFGTRNPSLIKEITDWGANAILVFGWNFYSHLRAMQHFKNKIPVLFRGDSTLLDDKPGLMKVIRRLFLTWVYKHIDTALYVGSNNRQYYRHNALKDHQLVFAPHAIDNDRFHDGDGKYGVLAKDRRAELGVPEEAFLIVFAGKFQGKKDPELLIETINEIRDPDIHLLMIGNGELEDSLKEIAADNRNIHFLPFQNQSVMPVVYRVGDIFCLPSRGPGETWGLSVNEAMACGRPVLVSDKCGCSTDLIENDRNGFVFKAGNKEDLTSKIRFLKALGKERERMGKASELIIKRWSYEETIVAIEETVLKQYE